MSFVQFPASAADPLIEGYCDELLALASLLAETLSQVASRGLDVSASHATLDRTLEGLASLAAVAEEARQSHSNTPDSAVDSTEPKESTAPTESGEDVPFGTVAVMGNDFASQAQAGTAETSDDRKPEEADESGHKDVDKRFAAAYSFFERPDSAGSGPDTEADDVDPNALMHFAKRPAPGLARALKSLPPADAAATSEPVAGQDDDACAPPSLKGSSSTMPLSSVFQFIERVRKSGVLRVELADEVMTFEFDGGWVYGCRTSNPDKGDRLGDFLASIGGDEELKVLLAKGEAMNNVQIGELVVRSGLLTNGQVLNALEAQVRSRFNRACDAPAALYEFVEEAIESGDGRIRITPMELAFESRA